MTNSTHSSLLIESIRACKICTNLPLGPRPIVQFSSTAKLLIVGQAPGRITHHKGIPFDDPSGDRLRSWLGITKETFYDSQKIAIVPMGFCFPGTGKGGDLPPRVECADAWRSKVLDELHSIELTLVIGRYAIDWHLPEFNKKSVTEAVKSWSDFWPQKLILPHPSPRNNRWLKQNPWFDDVIIPSLQDRVRTMFA
ncbi:MAG: uracil-DNA glycosylase family protein, partial [Pseudoruegeria sp.]